MTSIKMSLIGSFSRLASHRVKQTAAISAIYRHPTFSLAVRKYAANKPEQNKPGQNQPQRLLNEDLLADAGMEEIETKSESLEKETKDDNESSNPRKRSRRLNKTSGDLKREKWASMFYIFLFAATGAASIYMARDWDEGESQHLKPGEEPIPNGYTPSLMAQRLLKRWKNMSSVFSDPVSEKLLPDPPTDPNMKRPLTVVVSLEDLLVHSEWDQKHGWRVAKRPGFDYFVTYLSGFCELILFADNYMMYVERTYRKLDPYEMFFSGVLSKESARLKDGKVIKDLSLLNRDLGKVIILDTKEEHFSLQPENGILMKPWDGKPDDGLIKIIPFLEYLAFQEKLKDVRPILNTYKDRSKIPEEFERREKLLREQWKKEHGSGSAGLSFLAKLSGAPPSSLEPKMRMDRIRDANQENYKLMKKYLDEVITKEAEKNQQLMAQSKVTMGEVVGSLIGSEDLNQKIQAKMAEAQQKQQDS